MPTEFAYEKRGRVAWLKINRPEHGNRLTPAVAADLASASAEAGADDSIDVIVLTGMGNVFCQGLVYPESMQGPHAAQAIRTQFGELHGVAALATLTKPIVAAINGDALDVGLELALACDIRVAAEGAKFGFPQIAAGLIPFCGGTQRLPRIIGQAKALELILTGETISANEAQRIGLVSETTTAADFTTRVDELLQNLLEKGPIALRFGKEAVQKALDLTLDQGLRLEEDLYALLQTTQDRAEGVSAFLEKRQPKFKGQ
ncbi:MAG: enoyl-CoA hydratase/isomerase family protein [Candidatus Binatia bacterium]